MVINKFSKKFSWVFLVTMFLMIAHANSQAIRSMPDSLRRYNQAPIPVSAAHDDVSDSLENPVYFEANTDSLVKIKLVNLAYNNPAIKISESNIKISYADLDKTKLSWLGNVSVGANINEFVISNSAAASFFPKYNLGIIFPLDFLKKMKRDKIAAEENINIARELKTDKMQTLKTEVLIRYENYKEMKEVVFLQKSFLEYDFSNYETARAAYSDGNGSIIDMNKSHQNYLIGKSKLVSLEKDLNISIIRLEEMINVPLEIALQLP